MARYTFVGLVETTFPTLPGPDGGTLVCQPGDVVDVELEDGAEHPLLEPVRSHHAKPAETEES